MTEDNAPAELEETEEIAPEEGEDDDELYAVVSSGVKSASPAAIARGEDDDSPFHKIDFMHDVPLRLSVEIGSAQISVREILSMAVGKVVEFTKVVGEPMDITVSGRLMARGEIVVVNERYGVRISEVTRPDETDSATAEGN
jgi:flagellar motor switch protein FliN/FliY